MRGFGAVLLLAPWWFLTGPEGRAWLRDRSGAELVMLLHVNRGNVGDIERAVAEHAEALPPLWLPRQRLESRELAD